MSEKTHFRPLACLYSSLKAHFGQNATAYVAVQTPLHYEEQRPTSAKQPDLMVIKGLKTQERAMYHLWEEQKVPSVIFEITSGATWLEDLVNKSALYMQLGVKEYFIFDPHGEFLKDRLQGLRLVEQQGRQEYVPIALDKHGKLYSEELEAHLVTHDGLLRLVDDETNTIIPWAEELHGVSRPAAAEGETHSQHAEALRSAQEQLKATEERLRQTEERMRQVESQANRNGHDGQRLKTLEAENAHLRVLLGQMQGTKVMR